MAAVLVALAILRAHDADLDGERRHRGFPEGRVLRAESYGRARRQPTRGPARRRGGGNGDAAERGEFEPAEPAEERPPGAIGDRIDQPESAIGRGLEARLQHADDGMRRPEQRLGAEVTTED